MSLLFMVDLIIMLLLMFQIVILFFYLADVHFNLHANFSVVKHHFVENILTFVASHFFFFKFMVCIINFFIKFICYVDFIFTNYIIKVSTN